MSFNSDASKQAVEIICSHEIKKSTHIHPLLVFNNTVSQTKSQKHLRVTYT